MDLSKHIDHVADDSRRFLEVATERLNTSIDHLAPWTVADLARHLGEVYAFVTANVCAATTEVSHPGSEGQPPAATELLTWLAERRDALVVALQAADPQSAIWTFAGVRDVAWWSRRMASETVVHRFDVEQAADTATAIDGDLAADGVDEYVEVGLRFSSSRPNRSYPEATLHLHRTDGPGEWMFTRGSTEHEVVVTREHAKGDAAVRGSASDLLLWVWGRPVNNVEIFGDHAVAAAWQAIAP